MSETTLREAVDRLFEWAIDRTQNQSSLTQFHRTLQESYQRLQQPMRVAIVGVIKAGKSTLMNALLGEAVVATGAVEATFNVNWLSYGEEPSLRVHYKDESRLPEVKSFQTLTDLTLRTEESMAELLKIKYIEVSYPNDMLKVFNLIDTPGLKSTYEDDAQNTRDFLSLHGDQLTEVTQQEAGNADAVLYLFSHSLGEADKEIVEQFQGATAGQATPINAIGVLTKVDCYWSDPNVAEPLATGQRVATRLADHPQIRPLLYTIYPVCGLLAYGAKTLTTEEFATLTELADLPPERLERLLRSVNRFREKEYEDVPVAPIKRQQVLDRLGQFGVSLACDAIRNGLNDPAQVSKKLLEQSGIQELQQLVLSHFGHRAFLIKLSRGLSQIEAAWFRERSQLQGASWQIVDEVAGKFDELKSKEHAFRELDVLRSYYKNELDFLEEEREQLLAVTGENGIACSDRLGLDNQTTVEDMIGVAKEHLYHWHQRADDYMGNDRQTVAAARVLVRSYERILDRLQKAQEHLKKAQEYLHV